MVSASMKVQLRLDDDGRILNGDQQKAAGEAAASSARRVTAPKRKEPVAETVPVGSVQVAAVAEEEPAGSGSNLRQKVLSGGRMPK